MNTPVFRRALWLCALAIAQTASPLRADDTQPAVVPPRGETTDFEFADSKIFPGTTRHCWVYVPQQYDPAKPACLYVNQDGVQYKAPEVFDQLIASHEMPVTIGVFVTPGRVPAIRPTANDRFNRSVEYDTPTDDYARFLIEDLLPVIEQRKTADGRPIHLSHEGNDRCIAGASSGAICALTAAWERPDSFRRVFSTIGTYVDLRGGDCYSMLVRKSEPKPLRVFLQDGSSDLNIYGGDWWMANQTLERALVFSGYEVNHAWGDGGHSQDHGTAIFADAMRWIWKDWPAPIKTGAGSAPLQAILLPGEPWKLVVDGLKQAAAPAANEKGEVVFTDTASGKSFRIDPQGEFSPRDEQSPGFGAQAFGPDGRLYSLGERGFVSGAFGGAPEVTIDRDARAGDVVARFDGSLYVSRPGDNRGPSQLWYINPQGVKTALDVDLKRPTGLTFFPDKSQLLVADGHSHWVYSYQLAADGSLENAQRFHCLHVPMAADHAAAGGLAADSEGRLYVATNLGVQVCDPAGRVNCILPTPIGKPTQLCFGGEDFSTLIVTCGNSVYSRKLKVEGAPPFGRPIKLEKPRL